MQRGMRFLIPWFVGLVVGALSAGASYAQAPLPQDAFGPAVPAELRAWLEETASPPLLSTRFVSGGPAHRSTSPMRFSCSLQRRPTARLLRSMSWPPLCTRFPPPTTHISCNRLANSTIPRGVGENCPSPG